MEEKSEPAGLTVARLIVGYGWKVVPGFVASSGDKVPVAGGDWVRKATLDVGQLETWWAERPYLWPGTVSGIGSSFVLDADGPAAVSWIRELASGPGCWNTGGLVYRTPGRGGGLHCVWNWPSWLERDFRQAKVRGVSGEVQLRGNGHWTLLAGARRKDGEYTVVQEPLNGVSTEPPRCLIDAIIANAIVAVGGSYGGSGLEEVSPSEAWEGAPWIDGRKNLLAGLAWYLAIRGGSLEEVLEECLNFASGGCDPPLDSEFVRNKVEYTVNRAEKRREESKRISGEKNNQLLSMMSRQFGDLL